MRIKRLYEYNDDEFEEEDDTTHEHDDGVCFYCGSDDIEYNDFNYDVSTATQDYYCPDCNSTGWFEYTVSLKENHGDQEGNSNL